MFFQVFPPFVYLGLFIYLENKSSESTGQKIRNFHLSVLL